MGLVAWYNRGCILMVAVSIQWKGLRVLERMAKEMLQLGGQWFVSVYIVVGVKL